MYINRVTRNRLRRFLPYVFIILMVLFALWFQITHDFFLNGTDSFFHMSVTYDTYLQIKHWNFSYFLSMFGFNHSLRIVNAVYGPLGGYFSGLILLLTGSWTRWEITMLLIVLTIAGVSMYQLCRYWQVNKIVSILVSYLYMFTFPIIALWFNSQYDGVGAAFIPWVLLLGSKIMDHDHYSIWKYALILVVMAEVHVFSVLLAGLVLALCFIMSWFTGSDVKHDFIRLFKLMIITLVLSANVWGGIIEVLGSNDHYIIPTYSFSNMFQNIWSCVRYVPGAPISQNLKLLGLSGTVLIIIIFVLYFCRRKSLSPQLTFITLVLGLAFLWLSSRYFPWNILQKSFPILNTDLQFPKRFLPVSLSALDLILGVIVTDIYRSAHNGTAFFALAIVILGCFVAHAYQNVQQQYQNEAQQTSTMKYYRGKQFRLATGDVWLVKPTARNVAKLHRSCNDSDPCQYFHLVTKTTPDYLPSNQQIKTDAQYHDVAGYYHYYQQVVQYDGPKLHYYPGGHMMRVTFNSPKAKPLTLPLVKYAHTHVTMNGMPLNRYQRTQVGALTVHPKVGHNEMTFKYEPAGWYVALIWLSVIVWLMLLVAVVLKFKRHLNQWKIKA